MIIIPPYNKEFNSYKVCEDYIIIYLKKRDGRIFETIIDIEDLGYIKSLDLHWCAMWCEDVKGYYAQASEYLGTVNGKPKYKTHYLHKEIMKSGSNKVVDHINHDTLNNRKINLRVIDSDKNLKHRKGRNSNNTSGYRNVSWIYNKWCVQLQIEGKNTLLKKFPLDKLEEAGAFAKEMREKYYGEFQGN